MVRGEGKDGRGGAGRRGRGVTGTSSFDVAASLLICLVCANNFMGESSTGVGGN